MVRQQANTCCERMPPSDTKGNLGKEESVSYMDSGEARLRELGYKQELRREWGLLSSFSGSLALMAFTTGITGDGLYLLCHGRSCHVNDVKPPSPPCLKTCCSVKIQHIWLVASVV